MAAVVKQMAQMSMLDKIRTLTGLGRVAATNPAAQIMAPKIGTGKRLTSKEREKLRKQREKEERRRRREERKAGRAGLNARASRLTTGSLAADVRQEKFDLTQVRGDARGSTSDESTGTPSSPVFPDLCHGFAHGARLAARSKSWATMTRCARMRKRRRS